MTAKDDQTKQGGSLLRVFEGFAPVSPRIRSSVGRQCVIANQIPVLRGSVLVFKGGYVQGERRLVGHFGPWRWGQYFVRILWIRSASYAVSYVTPVDYAHPSVSFEDKRRRPTYSPRSETMALHNLRVNVDRHIHNFKVKDGIVPPETSTSILLCHIYSPFRFTLGVFRFTHKVIRITAYPTSQHGQEIVNTSLWLCTTKTDDVCRNKYKERLILNAGT